MKSNQSIKKVKGWAMFLRAYYPVFVAAFEGREGGKGGPPTNHALAKLFEDAGEKVLWEECTITYTLPTLNKRKKV